MFEFLRVQCLLGKITYEQLKWVVGTYITEEELDELAHILQSRTGATEK